MMQSKFLIEVVSTKNGLHTQVPFKSKITKGLRVISKPRNTHERLKFGVLELIPLTNFSFKCDF